MQDPPGGKRERWLRRAGQRACTDPPRWQRSVGTETASSPRAITLLVTKVPRHDMFPGDIGSSHNLAHSGLRVWSVLAREGHQPGEAVRHRPRSAARFAKTRGLLASRRQVPHPLSTRLQVPPRRVSPLTHTAEICNLTDRILQR